MHRVQALRIYFLSVQRAVGSETRSVQAEVPECRTYTRASFRRIIYPCLRDARLGNLLEHAVALKMFPFCGRTSASQQEVSMMFHVFCRIALADVWVKQNR